MAMTIILKGELLHLLRLYLEGLAQKFKQAIGFPGFHWLPSLESEPSLNVYIAYYSINKW